MPDPFARYDQWLEGPYESPAEPIDYTHEDEMRRDEAADRKFEESRERAWSR
ncbi:MAG: hypothetical protein NUW01_13520 [Gemmatimonadaceae bacterium]|nr:hypothetical protein [Gemmatimonadaceae bacterium]